MTTSELKCGACGGELKIGGQVNGVTQSYVCTVCSTLHKATLIANGGNMSEKATQGEATGATITRPELLEKLRRLNEREADVSAQKKGEMKAFNDQLKDLKDEKKTVLEALKKTAAPEKK